MKLINNIGDVEMSAEVLTYEIAAKLLRYEPETGKLFWRWRPAEMFTRRRCWLTWNTRYADREAFTSTNVQGYRQGRIAPMMLKAHRVAWLLTYGEWPETGIDHVDGNRLNNRIENLRLAPQRVNAKNAKLSRSNTSGCTGVNWIQRERKWRAHAKVDGHDIHLGYFSNFDDAVAARREANMLYGFTERHGTAA
jgi:hypothetical protein